MVDSNTMVRPYQTLRVGSFASWLSDVHPRNLRKHSEGLEPRVGKDTRGSKKEGEDTEEFLIILRYHAC